MESVAGKIVFFSQIEIMERRSKRKWVKGFGEDAAFEQIDLGWFVCLKGSHEALHIGYDQPAFGPGSLIKVTIEHA